jgi:alpha-ketoglutarate-dependent taurine dioxygenase
MVVYQLDKEVTVDKSTLHALAAQLKLHRLDHNYCADEDGIAALQVTTGHSHEFIPYTNQPINWHTDGYYNLLTHQVHAIILHCSRPALAGGENELLDHEIAYIHLRDANSEYIAILMEADVMTIPAHWEDGVERRPLQTGPVFAIDSTTGTLHMRYTARARNIVWKKHPLVTEALACLRELFHSDSPYIFRHRLTANQGIICNNVLHTRSGFTDGDLPEQKRLLYRMRFYDRIEGT